jgi:hypothetical protein
VETNLQKLLQCIKELEDKDRENGCYREHGEANLQKRLQEKHRAIREHEATVHRLCEEHRINCTETLENTPGGRINELENKGRKTCCDRLSAELKLREGLLETHREKKEVESCLRDQKEYYERKLQQREQVERGLYGEVSRLQERLREEDTFARNLRDTVRVLVSINRETNFKRDEVIKRIKELEKKLQETTVLGQIKELWNKVREKATPYETAESSVVAYITFCPEDTQRTQYTRQNRDARFPAVTQQYFRRR